MFASRVLPGAALVRATRWRTSALISVDLPTFDRPTNATSGRPSPGKSVAPAALRTKVASNFTGLEWLEGRDGLEGSRSEFPSRLSCLSCPARPSMSNGVVADGAVRLRLRGGQTARQRFG